MEGNDDERKTLANLTNDHELAKFKLPKFNFSYRFRYLEAQLTT